MKNLILICIFISSLFSSEVKTLKDISELKEGKTIFLMFSTSYCPWCTKQAYVLENIELYRDDLLLFRVKDNSDVYKELLDKYPFVIEYFPTSYIVSMEGNDLDIIYEFKGYQKEKNILNVLKDSDLFE